MPSSSGSAPSTRAGRRTGWTGSPSTWANGGSTSAPRTPNRCCGSTSRRPRATSASATRATCWHRSRKEADMALDALLLEILACPEDKGPLYYVQDEDFLYNPRLTRKYLIRDDIPVMLIDEAETVDQAEHDRIMDKVAAQDIKPTFDA